MNTLSGENRGFLVPMMYHPSHDVLDLTEAERWYERVFGSPSASLASLIAKLPPRPGSGYPPNYSTFTLIGDVLMDTIDPTRYVIDGRQRLPTVKKPHLRLISWYIEGMKEAVARCGGMAYGSSVNSTRWPGATRCRWPMARICRFSTRCRRILVYGIRSLRLPL